MSGTHARTPSAVIAAVIAAVLALAGCTSGGGTASFQFVSPGGKSEFGYPAADRKPIGAMSGADLTGTKNVAVADFPGKVVVLNFWGSWCSPCRREAPQLQDASTELAPKGVQFLGLNVKDGKNDGSAFNTAKGVTYPSIFDPTMRTLLSIRGFPVDAIPSTIVLDRQHRVAHLWIGEVTKAELVAAVTPIAAER